MDMHADASTGREIYHRVWQLVRDRFYDRTRLGNWNSWEHRFDAQIDGIESGVRFASQILATLDDPYTFLSLDGAKIVPAPTNASTHKPPDAVTDEFSQPPYGQAIPAQEFDCDPNPANVLGSVSPSNIGYLRILSFVDKDVVRDLEAAAQRLADCRGILLDLRFNPGGDRAAALTASELFVDVGTLAVLEEQQANGLVRKRVSLTQTYCVWDWEYPDGTKSTEKYKRLNPVLARKPIIVLLSDITASSAEILAIAILGNGYLGLCLSIGTTSLGKATAQEPEIDLLGIAKLRLSIGRNLAPGGEWLGAGKGPPDGIDPDMRVEDARGPEALRVAAAEVRKMFEAA